RANRKKGESTKALELFEQQLQLATELEDRSQVGSAHYSIASVLGYDQERYAEALTHIDASFEIDQALDLSNRKGYDLMSRGRLLWQLGMYKEARTALDAAFAIAKRPEASYRQLLAWVHLAKAQMYLSDLRFAQASVQARNALDL